ncbi:MAG: anti-sigma factor [Acidimicrobiales bacterium]|nr:anti-sigma factor [Acidimicrobiales bacterium]
MTSDTPFDAAERRDLEHFTELARSLTVADTHLEEPPVDLWASIEAALQDESPAASPGASIAPGSVAPTATVTNLAEGRRQPERRLGRVLLGVAAGLLLVALVGVGLIRSGDSTDPVASVALSADGIDPLGLGLDGTAELIEVDGGYEIALDVSSLPEVDGFYELWIIDTDVAGMFSLGTVNEDGRFAVPAGVDIADFPVVDLSVEPIDGDPTHSGVSALRGVLDI